jgi:hypothetical protein
VTHPSTSAREPRPVLARSGDELATLGRPSQLRKVLGMERTTAIPQVGALAVDGAYGFSGFAIGGQAEA